MEKRLCCTMDTAPSYETVAKGPEFRSHPRIKTDEKPGTGTQSPTLILTCCHRGDFY